MSLSTSFTPSGGLTITTCEAAYNMDQYAYMVWQQDIIKVGNIT